MSTQTKLMIATRNAEIEVAKNLAAAIEQAREALKKIGHEDPDAFISEVCEAEI